MDLIFLSVQELGSFKLQYKNTVFIKIMGITILHFTESMLFGTIVMDLRTGDPKEIMFMCL